MGNRIKIKKVLNGKPKKKYKKPSNITVGLNEFDLMNDYDVNNMISMGSNSPPPRKKKLLLSKKTKRSKPKIIKSSLNPNASAFKISNELKKKKKLNISPPFDPHSQLQNGGVFIP